MSIYYKTYVGVIIACTIGAPIANAVNNIDEFQKERNMYNKSKPYSYSEKMSHANKDDIGAMAGGFVVGVLSPLICAIVIPPYIISSVVALVYDGSKDNKNDNNKNNTKD